LSRETSASSLAAPFEAHIANCLVIGEHARDLGDGAWTRSDIRLSLSGLHVTLRQEPWVISGPSWSSLRGQWLHTTTLVFEDLLEGDRDLAIDCAQAVSHLLGFLTNCEVAFYGWKHEVGESIGHQWTSTGEIDGFIPVLASRDGTVVRSFVEGSWACFLAERNSRKLPAVFHYLALAAKEGTPIELQLAIYSIVLEQLKYSFAVANNFVWIAPSFHVPGTSTPVKGSKRGFEALLNQMFAVFGMSPPLSEVVALRNELLHSGVSSRPFNELEVMRGSIVALIREFILRMLGYSGAFYTGENGGLQRSI